MKKIIMAIMAILFLFTCIEVGLAMERGNKRKGKYIYRKVYKGCFERGEVASKVPPVSPNTKTQAEWTTLFESGEYKEFGCQEEWIKLSEKDIIDIYTYLHDHASDSPTPAKCK